MLYFKISPIHIGFFLKLFLVNLRSGPKLVVSLSMHALSSLITICSSY